MRKNRANTIVGRAIINFRAIDTLGGTRSRVIKWRSALFTYCSDANRRSWLLINLRTAIGGMERECWGQGTKGDGRKTEV